MSKTLETLKTPSGKYKDSLTDEIERTYFPKELKSDSNAKNKIGIWIFYLFVIFIIGFLFLVLSVDKINVHISLIKQERPPINKLTAFVPSKLLDSAKTIVFKDATKGYIKGIEFGGSAINNSEILNDEIIFTREGAAAWASFTIDLNKPLDLTKNDIIFLGKRDGEIESMSIQLSDSEKKTCRLAAIHLSNTWKTNKVKNEDINGNFDTSKVIRIRFGLEKASPTSNNVIRETVHIKDITFIRR